MVKKFNFRDPNVFRHDIGAVAQALHKFFSELPELLLTMAYYTALRTALNTKIKPIERINSELLYLA